MSGLKESGAESVLLVKVLLSEEIVLVEVGRVVVIVSSHKSHVSVVSDTLEEVEDEISNAKVGSDGDVLLSRGGFDEFDDVTKSEVITSIDRESFSIMRISLESLFDGSEKIVVVNGSVLGVISFVTESLGNLSSEDRLLEVSESVRVVSEDKVRSKDGEVGEDSLGFSFSFVSHFDGVVVVLRVVHVVFNGADSNKLLDSNSVGRSGSGLQNCILIMSQ